MDLADQLAVSGCIVNASTALDDLRDSLEQAKASAPQLRMLENAVQAISTLDRSLRVVEAQPSPDS